MVSVSTVQPSINLQVVQTLRLVENFVYEAMNSEHRD